MGKTIKTKAGNHKKAVWLSYDLGLRGDYSSLYAWLDNHGASECGDAMAFLEIEATDDVAGWLKTELNQHVKLAPKDRLYVIYREGMKMKGRFINGGRKRAPWEGYAQQDAEDTEDAA